MMTSTEIYEDASRNASVEKLLSQDSASIKAETISLSGSEKHDEEAITAIRRGRRSTKYFKLLWSITVYALAIWGVYSLIAKAMPMLPHHTHSQKHVTLSEDKIEYYHQQEMVKVPLGQAPQEAADVKPEHHHEPKPEWQAGKQTDKAEVKPEHHHQHQQSKEQKEDSTACKVPDNHAEHKHHNGQGDEEKDEHAAHKAAQWRQPEQHQEHQGHQKEKVDEHAAHKGTEQEHHHHHPARNDALLPPWRRREPVARA